ncbi:MAG: hypothetical protein FWE31_00060 [Firmicutes bacterium]|nr:hypothetical protein [Bacillota bacterium]
MFKDGFELEDEFHFINEEAFATPYIQQGYNMDEILAFAAHLGQTGEFFSGLISYLEKIDFKTARQGLWEEADIEVPFAFPPDTEFDAQYDEYEANEALYQDMVR